MLEDKPVSALKNIVGFLRNMLYKSNVHTPPKIIISFEETRDAVMFKEEILKEIAFHNLQYQQIYSKEQKSIVIEGLEFYISSEEARII